jgi:hypothetical protein
MTTTMPPKKQRVDQRKAASASVLTASNAATDLRMYISAKETYLGVEGQGSQLRWGPRQKSAALALAACAARAAVGGSCRRGCSSTLRVGR